MNDVSRCGHDSSGDEEWKTHRYDFQAEDRYVALLPPESFSKNLNQYHVCQHIKLEKYKILSRSSYSINNGDIVNSMLL